MSRGTLDPACQFGISSTGLSPSLAGFPKTIPLSFLVPYAVRTPACTHAGLGSSHFARRYSGNRVFFLFLRLLRCFSSPGSLPYVMDWRMDPWSLLQVGFPIRIPADQWMFAPRPAAFRSLSRPSSALSAKASTLRSFLFDLHDFTPVIGPAFGSSFLAVRSLTSGVTDSHGVTGGVYKTRERIHRGILIRDY